MDKYKVHSDIKIYPNPASQFIIIEGISELPGHVMIYNNAGVLVRDCIMKSRQLDIGQLSTGIYTMVVEGQWFKIVKL